jgi:polar amino acid transport system substrate-binding protein
MTDFVEGRRTALLLGAAAVAGAGALAASSREAAAQAAPSSLLRKVIDRGRILVGTGSTNAPWHFENEKGELAGMDIAMARMLARALFDDVNKVEFVRQDPAARIPNINTGKVDIVIQFMTMSAARAQLVAMSRPYYVEGVALLSKPDGKLRTFDQLLEAGSNARVSVLQNVDAEKLVNEALPKASVMQLDTQANVLAAVDARRADAAVVDLSTVRWLVKQSPDRYFDAGKKYRTQLYGAAMRQGDPDWLQFVNTVFTIGMFGHVTDIYDNALREYFGIEPHLREPGMPRF